MGITKQELDEIKRLGLTHLATLLESVAGKEIETNLQESKDEKKTVDMKGHFDAMFEGQELDAEFVTKAKAIFETAVAEQAEVRLSEKFGAIDKAVETQLIEHQAAQDARIDDYLDYVVKDWLQENQVAIESNAKIQKATALIEGLQTLLSVNDISIVESSDEDKLAQAISEKEQIQEELMNAVQKINEAEKTVLALHVEAAINEHLKDFEDEDQARNFLKIASELTVENLEDFEAKLQTVKEAFDGQVATEVSENIEIKDEQKDELAEQVEAALDEALKSYDNKDDAKAFFDKASELVVESFEDFEAKLKDLSENFIPEAQSAESKEKSELSEKVITAIQEASKDFNEEDSAKFKTLVEALDVENFEDFEAKLKVITEDFTKTDVKAVDPKIASYIAAARATNRKK